MNCKRCGASLVDGAKFCHSCGLENPIVHWQKGNSDVMNDPSKQKVASSSASQPVNYNATSTAKAQNYSSANNTNGTMPVTNANVNNATAPKTATTTATKSGGSKFFGFLVVALIVAGIAYFVFGGGLKGTWVADDGSHTITFSDSSYGYFQLLGYSDDIIDFTYFTDGNVLELKTTETLFMNSETERFEYKVKGKTLELIQLNNGIVQTYHKE